MSDDTIVGNFRYVGSHAEEIEIDGETRQLGIDQFTGVIELKGRALELFQEGQLIQLTDNDPNIDTDPFQDPSLPLEDGAVSDETPEAWAEALAANEEARMASETPNEAQGTPEPVSTAPSGQDGTQAGSGYEEDIR